MRVRRWPPSRDWSTWGALDDPDLTEVELLWLPGRAERWVRFGQSVHDHTIDAERRILTFAPNTVFAFVRWVSNDFGTIASRIDIVRAVRSGEPITLLPYVTPGGEVVARLSGWPKVKRLLKHIDEIEQQGIDPAAVCLDHWRHASHRIAVYETPRAYNQARHDAWLRRQQIFP